MPLITFFYFCSNESALNRAHYFKKLYYVLIS